MIVRDYDPDDLGDDDDDPVDEPDDDDTDDCPHCGGRIYDDSEQCPRRGKYLSREDAPRRHPWWVTLGVVACLGMVIWWIMHP